MWTGVRPLRYRGDVFAVLDAICDSGKLNIDAIRIKLVEERAKREEKRLKILRVSHPIEDRRRKRKEFLTKAEQIVRVFQRAEFVRKDGEEIILTKKGLTIVKLGRKGDRRADALFIESLLNSAYRTYWLFLKNLRNHPVSIPRSLWKRNRELRPFIRKQGFPLDVWSFFILRDLYYEFGLLNYVADSKQEKTIPLFVLRSSNAKLSRYRLNARTPEGRIHYWPSVTSSRFLQMLAETYLSITEGRWNRILDLVELRERFSLEHLVPETEFNELFQAALNKPSAIRIVPSVGYISLEARRGYLTKVVNLPMGIDGLPLTHVRIEQRH